MGFEMKRVLHIMVGTGSYGGAEQFALSYYKKMDHEKVSFDFLFLHRNVLKNIKTELIKNSEIKELGTWKVNGNGIGNYLKTIKGVKNSIKQGGYEIVHINSGIIKVQITCLIAAKVAGAKVRIAHSHTARAVGKSSNVGIGDRIKTCLVRSFATDYFGCSKGAGEYLFGKKGIESKRFQIIPNAIDLEKYKFDEEKRKLVLSQQNEDRTPVFAHIGRFIEVKNQKFVIQVFYEIHKLLPDACLWMIGDGELLPDIKKLAKEYGIEDRVRFFGERSDVPELLQGIDALVFPSFHEGLSIVVVESQASGVNVYAADTLSKEHVLSSNIHFLSLDKSPEYWGKQIASEMNQYKKSSDQQRLIEAGYDINKAAKKLESFYLQRGRT